METLKKNHWESVGFTRLLFCLCMLMVWHCGKGLDKLFNEQASAKSIAVKNISNLFVSQTGYKQTVISWVIKGQGSYRLSINGTCAQGSLPSGTNAQGTSNGEVIDSSIPYSDLLIGSNSVHICFLNATNGNQIMRVLNIVRDDSSPVTSISPGTGNYSSQISPAISCTDSCDKIAYTINGSDPTFDTAGNITNGMLYANALELPDAGSTTVKFLSIDKAGNQETIIHSQVFTVDSKVPGLAKTSQDHDYISTTGFSGAQIGWSSDRVGLSFQVRVDGTDCATGSLLTSGTTSASNSFSVLASGLSGNGAHTVMVCVTNLVGNTGSFSTALNRDESVPSTAASIPSGNYSAVPTVNINCTGGCMKTAYTADGTDPDFDSNGNITNGTAVTAAFSPPDLASTTLKYRSFSLAGIKEAASQASSYVVDSDIPVPVVASNSQDYLSSGGFTSTQLTWSSPRGTIGFAVQKSGTSCATGTVISSGTATSGTNITTLSNTLFSSGLNAVRICLINLIGNQGASADFGITLDNTAPSVTVLPASGSYNVIQNVTASCSDNCLKLVYTVDGTSPAVGSDGTVSNGTVYSSAIALPDEAATDFRIIGVDLAGNVTSVQTVAYIVDSNVPTINIVSNSHDFITTNAGAYTNTSLVWNTDRPGLSYSIRIGGTGCSSGTVSTGSNGSGTTVSGDLTSVIQASQLAAGANTVRICVQNLIGTYGATTLTVTRDDTAPTVAYTPTNTATLVDPGISAFKLTFSEPLEADPAGTFDLKIYDGAAFQAYTISYTPTFDTGTYELAIARTTANDLPYNSQFKQTFTPSATIKDRAGNPFSGTISATFTTASRLIRNAMSDTGQNKCSYNPGTWAYDATCSQTYTVGSATAPFGQDAQYKFPGINENRSLTRSNHATFTADYIVTDNVTGIVYQGCLAGKSGATCATGTVNSHTWVNAINFCSTLNSANAGAGYAGRTNWRIPTRYELQRMTQMATNNPAVDTTLFPGMQAVPLWSFNGIVGNQSQAWTIDAYDGLTSPRAKTAAQKYLCTSNTTTQVRTYTDNGNGTVLDNIAGLTWQKCANGQTGLTCSGSGTLISWANALAYCENLNLGGFTDWRLPNVNEVFSLIDESLNGPTLSSTVFSNAYALRHWTSTNYSTAGADYVYGVDLWTGEINGWVSIGGSEVTRCVRGP